MSMQRYHARRTLRDARLATLDETAVITAILLLAVATAVAAHQESTGGLAWLLGSMGLGALGACATWRGVRLYRASLAVSLPSSVGKVGVRVRPRLLSTATTAALALVLPAGAAVLFVVAVDWGWLALAIGLLFGGLAMLVKAVQGGSGDLVYTADSAAESALLGRLCMRADIPVPELVVEWDAVPNAWTTSGRIHVTTRLVALLDQSELEAVLAHELAHLGHRDAAVMDVCSAPSRMLLGFAGAIASGFRAWMKGLLEFGMYRVALAGGILAALSVPPAFLFGWVSRLSVLQMSRSREFAADAASATLTGRPSALASALVKLDSEGHLMPQADLRQVEARAVLCILGTGRSRLGPLFSTHPPTAARVMRLREIEQRLQERG